MTTSNPDTGANTPQSADAPGPGPVVGIDLGTTNSVVAICDETGPRVLAPPAPDEGGEKPSPIFPSVVRYSEGAKVEAVGPEARAAAVQFPERTISSVKRLMGRSRADADADMPYLSYIVVEGANETARIAIGDNVITPQEVSAHILRALKQRAETVLGTAVHRAVVTVPAYFDDAQRQATRDAGRLAGLDIVRIVNEPTAAALAYGVGLAKPEPQTIAVYDLGGGTFDISILALTPAEPGEEGEEADPDAASFFQVISTAGDTHLGGDDVDQQIVRLLMDEIAQKFPDLFPAGEVDMSALPAQTRQALRSFAEQAKITLTSADQVPIRIDLGEGRLFERTLTRDELESIAAPWVERATAACKRALRDAKMTAADIDRVVLVGGSTRMPLVRRTVADFFGVDPYTALDPDLVVAMGASVQASIVAGLDRSNLLLDVIPLSLGIETRGGAVAKLIVRNQTVPARAKEMFSTSVDGQTSIKIHVLQGEREMVSDCRSLGEFHLTGLPPMPAGVPQLEVEFLVDANGVLNVSAIEKRSGKRAALQVVPSHGLSREEVDRMEAESFEHAREDMARHRIVDLVENSRLDIKWTRDQLDRVGAELDRDYKAKLEDMATRLAALADQADRDWRSVNPDDFHKMKQELDEATVRMHEVAIAASLREEEG